MATYHHQIQAISQEETIAIHGYIRLHYYRKLGKTESNSGSKIIDNGIIDIIHDYCKPLLFKVVNVLRLSNYTVWLPYPDANTVEKVPINHANIQSNPHKLKCMLIGPHNMGKTCLLIRYNTNAWPGEYIPTVYDEWNVQFQVHGQRWEIGLCDSAVAMGESKGFRQKIVYPDVDLFALCMSVYDNTPCEEDKSGMWTRQAVDVMALRQELQLVCSEIPCVLIGTKTDLREEEEFKQDCYTTEEMKMLANMWQCCAYAECSGLKDEGVKDAMMCVFNEAVKFRRSLLPKDKKTCVIL